MHNRWAESSPQRISSILNKNTIAKAVAVAVAIAVWQVAATVVDSSILLVSPMDVILRLKALVFEEGFLDTVGFTLWRIARGFGLGALMGAMLALVAGRFKLVEILLWPYMLTIKTVPVASFIVVAFIWLTASDLAVFISFLMVLPIVYTNILDGIKSVDRQMLEMADVFKMPFVRRLRYIWLPAIKPFALSGCKIALGLAWKAGVAAELIGYPAGSIGEQLYYSKFFLETNTLFAWTVVIIILSVSFEKLFLSLLKLVFKGVENK